MSERYAEWSLMLHIPYIRGTLRGGHWYHYDRLISDISIPDLQYATWQIELDTNGLNARCYIQFTKLKSYAEVQLIELGEDTFWEYASCYYVTRYRHWLYLDTGVEGPFYVGTPLLNPSQFVLEFIEKQYEDRSRRDKNKYRPLVKLDYFTFLK